MVTIASHLIELSISPTCLLVHLAMTFTVRL